MSAIAAAFARCREEERAAFVPFLMGGDPDLATSARLIEALAAGGADLIEVGVPFSDPVADGLVNQRAAQRALAAGARLPAVLEIVARCRERVDVPIVLFTYYNPVHCRGVGRFAEQAAASGVDGVLCVDLPPEEAEAEWVPALHAVGVDTVFLVAPTSTKARVARAEAASSGFVYYVSRTGVTGVAPGRQGLPDGLVKEVKRVRKRLDLPLVVGFGIADPEVAAAVGRIADGVVVGSALVRLVEVHARQRDLVPAVEARVREFADALRLRPARRKLFGRG
jgi:tryptophan synthase alpha chain